MKGRLNGFIVTLGMTIVLAGLQLGIVGGNSIFNLPAVFNYLGSASIGTVPVSFIVAAIIFAGVGLFLRYHRVGRAIYASAAAWRLRVRRELRSTGSESGSTWRAASSPPLAA